MANHASPNSMLKLNALLYLRLGICITALSVGCLPQAIFAKTATPTSATSDVTAATTATELDKLTTPLLSEPAKNGSETKALVIAEDIKSTPQSAPVSMSTATITKNDILTRANPNAIISYRLNGQNITLPAGILDKLSKSNISPDSISLIVQPLMAQEKQSKPLFSLFPNRPRTPASTQKLIPTFVALDKLGADFEWVTRIYQRGWLMNGALHGDIVIVGSGDPRLNHEALHRLLGALRAKGIHHIDGNIIVDNSIFQKVNFDPSAFDKQGLRAYNAPPNGFLINFGTLQVDFIPSGRYPLVSDNPVISPASANATTTDSSTVASQSPNQSLMATAPVSDTISAPASATTTDSDDEGNSAVTAFIVNPTAKDVAVRLYPPMADFNYPASLPASLAACHNAKIPQPNVTKDRLSYAQPVVVSCGMQTSWFTFPDSDGLISKAVKGTWQQLDSTFNGEVKVQNTPTNPEKKGLWQNPLGLPLVSYASAPLSEQIWDINHYSNNVMTEQVALSLPIYAQKDADKNISSDYPSTFKFINTWWQQHFKTTPPMMTRASGLCRDCQVEPASMMALLNYAYHGKNFEVFKNSMGVAGVSGTMKALKKRHPDSPAIGNAWIKTGTLDNVTSMAGYVKGNSGKWYAVVGMVNAPNVGHNDTVKAVLDEMLAWTAVQ